MGAADWGEICPIESGVGGAWGVSDGICMYAQTESTQPVTLCQLVGLHSPFPVGSPGAALAGVTAVVA